MPAQLLFIGEAPGKTEDLFGEAFVGDSGQLLDILIEEAAKESGVKMPSYYITNTVLCRPWYWEEGHVDEGKNREPRKAEILACMKNVLFIAERVKPVAVVFVGRFALNYYKKEFPFTLHITHPAAHLRYGGRSSPTYAYDVRNLSNFLRKIRI